MSALLTEVTHLLKVAGAISLYCTLSALYVSLAARADLYDEGWHRDRPLLVFATIVVFPGFIAFVLLMGKLGGRWEKHGLRMVRTASGGKLGEPQR